MPDTYKLTRNTLDCADFVDLTVDEFGPIAAAKWQVVIYVGIEEKPARRGIAAPRAPLGLERRIRAKLDDWRGLLTRNRESGP
jgi:hypothetical protein